MSEARTIAEAILLAKEKIQDADRLLETCRALRNVPGKSKLERKIQSEVRFLVNLAKKPEKIKDEHLRCTNLAYLKAVVECASSVHGLTDVLKPFTLPVDCGLVDNDSVQPGFGVTESPERIVVDVVSDSGATWIKVVARQPGAILASSLGHGEYGRRTFIDQVLDMVNCSRYHPYLYYAPKVKIWFAVQPIQSQLRELIEEAEAQVLEHCSIGERNDDDVQISSSSDEEGVDFKFLAPNEVPTDATLNLDVSTMIASVSALTNGRARYRFKENVLNEQAECERKNPVRPILDDLFHGRRLVCCRTAYNDFMSITNTLGGPTEKTVRDKLLQRVTIVEDAPSIRALSLECRGRVRTRSQVIFGTGDTLKAVTVTANSGFLRAAAGQGCHFVATVHESRALTESKEAGPL